MLKSKPTKYNEFWAEETLEERIAAGKYVTDGTTFAKSVPQYVPCFFPEPLLNLGPTFNLRSGRHNINIRGDTYMTCVHTEGGGGVSKNAPILQTNRQIVRKIRMNWEEGVKKNNADFI